MTLLWWLLGGTAVVLALLVAGFIYLAVILSWEDRATVGLGYYGRSAEGRQAYARQLKLHAVLLTPLLRLNARFVTLNFRTARVVHEGVAFPPGSCSAASVAAAVAYQSTADDIIVATQMKCGTTWMQHVVYEVLHRGAGNLVATGTAMYAVSAWMEGRRSVPLADAPRLGTERPSRILKTHLPAHLCPRSPTARTIYVARHPVSCFASCVDFVATNVGAMAPPAAAYEEWFTSKDLMWWGTWTDHVKGWWDRSAGDAHALFLTFEEMKRDLPGVVRRVAAFLDVAPLNDSELAAVVEKTGFAYMQRHQHCFEMHPPHILQTSAELFVRGSADRHKDVPEETRERLRVWAREELRGHAGPWGTYYGDVVE